MKKISYKDTMLTMSHYKEPLREIPKSKGFGYYGAILVTVDGDKIQCHICGELFKNLSMHIYNRHDMRVREYREQYMLNYTTRLVSETERQRMKMVSLKWWDSLSREKQREHRAALAQIWKKSHEKRGNFQPKERLEAKNKKGTCPDQLLAKIHEVAEKFGRTPSLAEFIDATGGQRYKHLIFTTFGSWKKALHFAKLKPKVQDRPTGPKRFLSDEELLEYLSLYAQENGNIPTATDSKRGLIPDYQIYTRRFGTFENARKLAGVYHILNK